jgi:hypothetical protein
MWLTAWDVSTASAERSHSPVPLPSGGDFASFKDPFAPRSPAFEPSEEDGELRGLHFGRRDGDGVSRSLACAPPDRSSAGRSPERARLDESRTASVKEGTRPA